MIRRLLAGMGLSTAIIAVTMVGQVIAVPVYFGRWGAQMYGEWLTLTGLVSALSVLNLGVQSYCGNRLIAAHAQGRTEEGTRILHGALRLYCVLCGLALCVTAGFLAWPGLLEALNIRVMGEGGSRVIIGIHGGLAAYAILGGLLMTLFRVVQRTPRQLFYGLMERTVAVTVPVAVALAGGSPVHASEALMIGMGVIAVVGVRDVVRSIPYSIGISGTTWRESWSLLAPSLAFFAVSFAAPVLSSGMVLVISNNIGASEVAVFSTVLALTNFVRLMLNQGLGVLWPEITAAAAMPGADRVARWHRLALKGAFVYALAGTVGITLLGVPVVFAWTRGRVVVDDVVNLVFGVSLVVQIPALVSGTFGLAMNRHREMMGAYGVSVVVALVAAVGMVPLWGLRGAAGAMAVGQVIGTLWIGSACCRWVGDRGLAVLRDVGLRGLPTFVFAVAVGAALWYAVPSLGGRVAGSVLGAILVLAVGWISWFSPEDRGILKGAFRRERASSL